jgi:hypothetical protein
MRPLLVLAGAAVLAALPARAAAQALTIERCEPGAKTQQFVFQSGSVLSQPGVGCVGLQSLPPMSGDAVAVVPCTPGDTTQTWSFDASTGFIASGADASLCWNVWSSGTSPGTPINLYACGQESGAPATTKADALRGSNSDFAFVNGSIIATASHLCVASAAPVPGPCQSNFDCSLNGICTSGICTCDAPWTGSDCGTLDFYPVDLPDG